MQNQKRIETYTVFQSTRPSQGETKQPRSSAQLRRISIHSPLAGRAHRPRCCRPTHQNFNPLAPRGARPSRLEKQSTGRRFQPTRPSRGETLPGQGACGHGGNFNPLAPRGTRQGKDLAAAQSGIISIHSPLAGRDVYCASEIPRDWAFQSTRPSRGETVGSDEDYSVYVISIHSPLAGRDGREWRGSLRPVYFNPLAPRGARQI